MSGHFATLLRDTVRTLLADHDVYVTDWHNARDVPLRGGPFGLDEYTEHVIASCEAIGPGSHLVAVCQPCVAALAATALMSEDGHPATPASLTLMAGPIDCRISPTAVNRLATCKPIEWFEQNLISLVPWRHAAPAARLSGLRAARRVHEHEPASATSPRLSRLLPTTSSPTTARAAEATRALLRRVLRRRRPVGRLLPRDRRVVFQDYALPRGATDVARPAVDPRAIRRTALLTIEGERDDICSLGQTLAAQDLCTEPAALHAHPLRAGRRRATTASSAASAGRTTSTRCVRDVIHTSH